MNYYLHCHKNEEHGKIAYWEGAWTMLNYLKKVALFQNLDETQLSRISDISSQKKYSVGTIIFQENEPGTTFYILIRGSVKIFTTNSSGEEKILSLIKEGESFGELSLIDGLPRSATAQTMEESIFCAIQGTNFIQLLQENFEMNLCILQELCQRLRDTNKHVHDLTFLDARTRVIKNLIILANKYGIRNGNLITITVSLNYDELARMAGVSNHELKQVINEFEKKQLLILAHNEFTLDLTKLRN